jgi:ATP-dependent helicase HrpB
MLLCANTVIAKELSQINIQQLTFLACIITALLEERDILPNEQSRFDCNLEHRITQLLAQWHKPYGALANIIKQVKNLAQKMKLTGLDYLVKRHLGLEKTGLLLAYAYPERIAKARGALGDFICANGKGVTLNDQDALAGEDFLVVADLMQSQGILQVRLAATIDLCQIEQVFSEKIIEQDIAIFDQVSGRIIARSQTKLAALTLQEKISQNSLTKESVAKMWCDLVEQKGLGFLNWQEQDLALKARWQWLNDYFPEYNLPGISEKKLLASLSDWFSPFVGEIKSTAKLAKIDLSSMLLSLLDYQQQQVLKTAAPTVYIGPTGRHCPIRYSKEKSPKVSLPMQELYGSTQTPSIGNMNNNQGIPLLLELLSPAQRPIQVTQDLAQFWVGSYQSVRKDMKSNYPRHFWPDDPANAEPTNKTKRHLKNQN